MKSLPPLEPTRGPSTVISLDNNTHMLAELLDDVFTRGFTGSNGTLKECLTRGSDCIFDYYKKVLVGENIDRMAHYRQYPGTRFADNLSPYETMIFTFPEYNSSSNSEGTLSVFIQKKNKVPFSPAERQILENYPMRLILKDSKGLEISRTQPAIVINAKDGGGSAVKLEFSFDIQNGTTNIKSGAETFEEHTRIIDLPIRTQLV